MRKLMMISAVAIIATQMASAEVFTINTDNSSGALCSAAHPCGTVTVTGTSTLHVDIELNGPYGIFGNNDAFGFSTVGSNSGVFLSNFSSFLFDGTGGSGNEDGWGSFEFRVDGPSASHAIGDLSFDVKRFGSSFTSPTDIEQGATGGNGYTVFGLHIRNNTTGFTGYAGVTSTNTPPPMTDAPEPASIALSGLGALGAFGFGVFRKRQARQ